MTILIEKQIRNAKYAEETKLQLACFSRSPDFLHTVHYVRIILTQLTNY